MEEKEKFCIDKDLLTWLLPLAIIAGAYFFLSKFIFTALIIAVLVYLYFKFK